MMNHARVFCTPDFFVAPVTQVHIKSMSSQVIIECGNGRVVEEVEGEEGGREQSTDDITRRSQVGWAKVEGEDGVGVKDGVG